MKAAILLPGVTPDEFPSPSAYPLVVAVDVAGHDHSADWWVVSGADAFESKHAKGDPGVFTTEDVERQIANGLEKLRLLELPEAKLKRYEPLWEMYPASLGWSLYPASAAIVLAASLGATEIDIHGETLVKGERSAACLKCEHDVLKGLAAHLLAKGVSVDLVFPAE